MAESGSGYPGAPPVASALSVANVSELGWGVCAMLGLNLSCQLSYLILIRPRYERYSGVILRYTQDDAGVSVGHVEVSIWHPVA